MKRVVSSHGVVHLAVNKRFFGRKKKEKKFRLVSLISI